MSLYTQLQQARSEEDVKDAHIKSLGHNGLTKGLIDRTRSYRGEKTHVPAGIKKFKVNCIGIKVDVAEVVAC